MQHSLQAITSSPNGPIVSYRQNTLSIIKALICTFSVQSHSITPMLCVYSSYTIQFPLKTLEKETILYLTFRLYAMQPEIALSEDVVFWGL